MEVLVNGNWYDATPVTENNDIVTVQIYMPVVGTQELDVHKNNIRFVREGWENNVSLPQLGHTILPTQLQSTLFLTPQPWWKKVLRFFGYKK